MIFELIFIRHGESCANALHKSERVGVVAHKFYGDPELTSRGVDESENRGKEYLLPVLEKSSEFAVGNFTVGSSPLLRAQETAYLMVAKPFNKNIYIMPHIGETGFAEEVLGGRLFTDNRPDAFTKQRSYMSVRYPEYAKFPLFDESKMNAELAPNFEKFKTWMKENADKGWFIKSEKDGVYRAVIVSHSNSLREAFPYANCVNPPEPPANLTDSKKQDKWKANWKLNNNDFLVSIFDFRDSKPDDKTMIPGTFIDEEKDMAKKAIYPNWLFFDTQGYKSGDKIPCGRNAKCGTRAGQYQKGYYIPPSPLFLTAVPVSGCKTGGSRKTRKQRKSRKQKHKRKATQRR